MDPIQKLIELYAQAGIAPCHDPNAMTLSTVGPDGRPAARMVLLKGIGSEGLTFFTNSHSRKGQHLGTQPHVALTLWWPHIGRQVRVEGPASPVSDAEADAYFATRARGSQLGAWASAQSEPLSSREALEARLAEVTRQYEGKTVPRPSHWKGYRVTPLMIELWHERDSRLHEREQFVRDTPAAPWRMQLLNP